MFKVLSTGIDTLAPLTVFSIQPEKIIKAWLAVGCCNDLAMPHHFFIPYYSVLEEDGLEKTPSIRL
jgi:hypothetical protein